LNEVPQLRENTPPRIEIEWVDDGNDAELNIHMDLYEGWGEDFNEINELFKQNF